MFGFEQRGRAADEASSTNKHTSCALEISAQRNNMILVAQRNLGEHRPLVSKQLLTHSKIRLSLAIFYVNRETFSP